MPKTLLDFWHFFVFYIKITLTFLLSKELTDQVKTEFSRRNNHFKAHIQFKYLQRLNKAFLISLLPEKHRQNKR